MENVGQSILEGLDAQQRQAVTKIDGPVLIVAGAGSGKTRVLTSRIAYLLAQGKEPERILALTFTKKAAGEMKERIAALVGQRAARRLWMGTFHSVFIRFLREWADRIGYPASFTVWDESDAQSAVKRCIRQLELDDKVYKPKDVLARISNAKNNLVTPGVYKANAQAIQNDTRAKKPRICDIYAAYQAMAKGAGVMDFDDILLNMNILLRDCPEALQSLSERFDYLLVDEYQDTNFAQYRILRELSRKKRNICVVGDDSQSIYKFRGARIENILGFRKDYPEAAIFRLERNYRSTKNIVGAANSVIAKNEGRIPKQCYSDGPAGEPIRLVQAFDERSEASQIASGIISRMQADHAQYQDFAILYRTNSQSRAIEEALRTRNLPYTVFSGRSFYERAEVRDMMAYLKLVVNPDDNESFRRAVGKPARGIGETTVDALDAVAGAKGQSLTRAAMASDNGLRAGPAAKVRTFAEMILRLHERVATTDAWTLATELSDACGLYRSLAEENTVESQSRAANVMELLNGVKEYVERTHVQMVEDMMAEGMLSDMSEVDESTLPTVTLDGFLEDVALLSNADEDEEEAANRVALMTVHTAKGLEFPYVYVAGMEENLFPSGGILASPDDIEEERRLFYVALTRAQKAACLTFAQSRMRNGKHESNAPSRFLREMAPQYLANPLRKDDTLPSGSFSFGSGKPSFGGFGSAFGRGAGGVTSSGRSGRPGPSVRTSSGRPGVPASPSRPAAPIPVGSAAPRHYTPDPNFVPDSVLDLRCGDRIEHNRFGFGRILELSGGPGDLKASIAFDEGGRKILLLKYAKIRKIE